MMYLESKLVLYASRSQSVCMFLYIYIHTHTQSMIVIHSPVILSVLMNEHRSHVINVMNII